MGHTTKGNQCMYSDSRPNRPLHHQGEAMTDTTRRTGAVVAHVSVLYAANGDTPPYTLATTGYHLVPGLVLVRAPRWTHSGPRERRAARFRARDAPEWQVIHEPSGVVVTDGITSRAQGLSMAAFFRAVDWTVSADDVQGSEAHAACVRRAVAACCVTPSTEGVTWGTPGAV